MNSSINPEENAEVPKGGTTIGHSYDLDIPGTPYSADRDDALNQQEVSPERTEQPEVQVPNENEASNPEQSDASYNSQPNEVVPPRENEGTIGNP